MPYCRLWKSHISTTVLHRHYKNIFNVLRMQFGATVWPMLKTNRVDHREMLQEIIYFWFSQMLPLAQLFLYLSFFIIVAYIQDQSISKTGEKWDWWKIDCLFSMLQFLVTVAELTLL